MSDLDPNRWMWQTGRQLQRTGVQVSTRQFDQLIERRGAGRRHRLWPWTLALVWLTLPLWLHLVVSLASVALLVSVYARSPQGRR